MAGLIDGTLYVVRGLFFSSLRYNSRLTQIVAGNRYMNKDWYRALLLTPFIVGVLCIVFGIVWYGIVSNQIDRNFAYQIRSQSQQVDPQSQTEAIGLIRAGEELRELDHNRSIATIVGGAGLMLVAVGWLARDFMRGRQGSPTATKSRANDPAQH